LNQDEVGAVFRWGPRLKNFLIPFCSVGAGLPDGEGEHELGFWVKNLVFPERFGIFLP
jgi:hypothetical protein